MEQWVSGMMLSHSRNLSRIWDIDYMKNHLKNIIVFVNKCYNEPETHDNYKYQGLLIDFLNHKHLILLNKIFHKMHILLFNISIP